MCKRIKLYYQKTNENLEIVSKLKGLEKVFYPHILWLLPQIQTIAYFVRKIPKNEYKEVEIEQEDGGSFFIHIYSDRNTNGKEKGNNDSDRNTDNSLKDKPTIILLHGLGGSVYSKHVTILCSHFLDEGYRVVIMGARGTTHKLKTPVFFHIGWTKDYVSTVKYVLNNYGGTIGSVGFSLGGHWLTKTFGELYKHFTLSEIDRIKGGMAISVPFDFVKISKYMMQPIPKRIYNRVFAKKIHKFVVKNKSIFIDNGYDVDKILNSYTMHEIDKLLTLKVFNIEDIDKYYYDESCVRVIKNIDKPFLILNSKDDPIVPGDSIPITECEKSTHVILALTERGGHMGFLGYSSYMTYAEEAAIEFMRAVNK